MFRSEFSRGLLVVQVVEKWPCMWFFFEQEKGVVYVPLVEDWFEFGRAVLNPGFFVMAHKNICKSGPQGKSNTKSFNLFVKFTRKYEERVHNAWFETFPKSSFVNPITDPSDRLDGTALVNKCWLFLLTELKLTNFLCRRKPCDIFWVFMERKPITLFSDFPLPFSIILWNSLFRNRYFYIAHGL